MWVKSRGLTRHQKAVAITGHSLYLHQHVIVDCRYHKKVPSAMMWSGSKPADRTGDAWPLSPARARHKASQSLMRKREFITVSSKSLCKAIEDVTPMVPLRPAPSKGEALTKGPAEGTGHGGSGKQPPARGAWEHGSTEGTESRNFCDSVPSVIP